MTIKELYEWAVAHNCENYDLLVYDYDGCHTYLIQPEIDKRCETVEL